MLILTFVFLLHITISWSLNVQFEILCLKCKMRPPEAELFQLPLRSDMQVTDGTSAGNIAIALKQFGLLGVPTWLDLAGYRQWHS